MGIRQFQIEQFEAQTGIKSATGDEAKVLNDLSKLAYELIRVVELERSGIRDGDGYWSGTDPIQHICKDIDGRMRELSRLDEEKRRALGENPEDESLVMPF
jgi:hypothetical protein